MTNRRKTSIGIKIKTHVINIIKHICLVGNSILNVFQNIQMSYRVCLVSFKKEMCCWEKFIKLSRLSLIAIYILLKSHLFEIKLGTNCQTSKIYRARTFTLVLVYINLHFMEVIKAVVIWIPNQFNTNLCLNNNNFKRGKKWIFTLRAILITFIVSKLIQNISGIKMHCFNKIFCRVTTVFPRKFPSNHCEGQNISRILFDIWRIFARDRGMIFKR